LNISVALSMAFAAEGHLAERQFRRLKSTLNKLQFLKFRFGTPRPTVSKRVRQYFKPMKTVVQKRYLDNNCNELHTIVLNIGWNHVPVADRSYGVDAFLRSR
jgi:hypothetical protein